MLKACSPVVVPIASWSKQCPHHEITKLLFSQKLTEIVTGGSGGELIIWNFDSKSNFWPRWMCFGHTGSVKNLDHARCAATLSNSYFISHSSANELAIWNWEDGTCMDIRVDQNYRHTRIKSFQPRYTEARLLFCSGQYPCIVVMHAMELANLFILASNAYPNWIQDFSLFTHSQLKQEVVLGVTNSGAVTVWTLTGQEALNSINYEHESRMIQAKSSILRIHCCKQLPRLVLLICENEWKILDAIDCSTQILESSCDPNEHFTGGEFFHREYIAIFTVAGAAYIYRLPNDLLSHIGDDLTVTRRKPEMVIKMRLGPELQLDRPIGCDFHQVSVKKVNKENLYRLGAPIDTVTAFICGLSDGQICAWGFSTDQLVEPGAKPLELVPFLQTSLSDVWVKVAQQLSTETGFFNPTSSSTDVITSCIIAYTTGSTPQRHSSSPLQIRGTAKGDIVITSPLLQLYRFRGHQGAVLCLLHPFSFTLDRATFRPSLFLSGGADFAIRLWDLDGILTEKEDKEGEIRALAVFYNHAAPIIALTVGPVTRPSYLAACVVAVADDGTVSVISPNDRYTLLRARTASGGFANTPATVHAISWRLAEMMLLILSADGSLAVWDVGSGQLERCENGSVVMALFNSGSDAFVIGSSRPSTFSLVNACVANQSASAASVFHRTAAGRIARRTRRSDHSEHFFPPLMMQSAGANVCGGPIAFVFHFDPEALITDLLSFALGSKDIENSTVDIPLNLRDCGNLLRFLISTIYPWSNHDSGITEIDMKVLEVLQLKKRPEKINFGCLSMTGYLTLRIPGPLDDNSTLSEKVVTNLRLVQVALADALSCMPSDRLSEIFPTFTSSDPLNSLLVKSIFSNTSFSSHLLGQLRLHSLLARWHAKCPHIRYGARALAYSLLDALSVDDRQNLVNQWAPFLPNPNNRSNTTQTLINGTISEVPIKQNGTDDLSCPLKALDCCESMDLLQLSIKLESGIFDSFAFGPTQMLNASSVHRYRVVNCAILILAAIATRAVSTELPPPLAARDLCVELNCPSTSVAASLSPYYGSLSSSEVKDKNLLEDEIMRRIASALMVYLDYESPAESKQHVLFQLSSPIRRTAIDFLGRGFPLWEPYLDTAHLLNSLLKLIAEEIGQMDDLQPGEVFNEQRQDVSRSARQALWRLTFTRPHLVVLTLSLMLRRLGSQTLNAMLTYNSEAGGNSQRLLRVVVSSPALAAPIFSGNTVAESPRHIGKNIGAIPQSGNQTLGNGQPMGPVLPLLLAAPEVLRVLTELSGRRGEDMTPILPELVEVVLVCVNRTRLKERGLQAVFPILQRFHAVDSHTRAQKVCVGGTNGMLIFFDFKSGRYHSLNAHRGPITAVCFNSEGRQLASFSMQENAIKTWQLSSTGIFGIGGQQVRPLNTYPIRPLQRPGGASSLANLDPSEIALAWPSPEVVNLFHADVLIRSVVLSN